MSDGDLKLSRFLAREMTKAIHRTVLRPISTESSMFGDDIGQNSLTLKREYEGFLQDLQSARGKRLLDVACGGGRPALFSARKTGCSVVRIDMNADGIATAKTRARELGLGKSRDLPSDRYRYENSPSKTKLSMSHLKPAFVGQGLTYQKMSPVNSKAQ